VKTHGLTHVAPGVRDPRRSLAFYRKVIGVVPVYVEDNAIQAQTPGTHDVLVFERDPKRADKRGGVVHFGFRLVKPVAVSSIVRRIGSAGGKIPSKGEFAPGLLYVFCSDPDGYEVEIWFESPMPADPRPRGRIR